MTSCTITLTDEQLDRLHEILGELQSDDPTTVEITRIVDSAWIDMTTEDEPWQTA